MPVLGVINDAGKAELVIYEANLTDVKGSVTFDTIDFSSLAGSTDAETWLAVRQG